jgi:hypothetical protein
LQTVKETLSEIFLAGVVDIEDMIQSLLAEMS